MSNFVKQYYWTIRENLREFFRVHLVDPVRTCTVRGNKLHIGFSNPLEGYRISTYSSKEPETLDWLEQSLKSEDVLFDIGANIGLYSVYAATIEPRCKVYAFEPEALNYTRLIRNIIENKKTNIIPVNIALCETTKFDFFYVNQGQVASSALHSFGEQINGNFSIKQGTFGLSLDDLVFQFGLPQPTHIKIDVDGLEEQILKGAEKVFKSPQLRSALIEISAENLESNPIRDFLMNHGFLIKKKSDWIMKSGNKSCQNFIFSR